MVEICKSVTLILIGWLFGNAMNAQSSANTPPAPPAPPKEPTK
jgi:hypothetical protein